MNGKVLWECTCLNYNLEMLAIKGTLMYYKEKEHLNI